jgi:hypothetical protein
MHKYEQLKERTLGKILRNTWRSRFDLFESFEHVGRFKRFLTPDTRLPTS